MSAQPAAAGGKVCVVCGTDVSKKPRVKDSQGRYMCEGTCEQTARERAKIVAGKQSTPRPASPKMVAPPPVVDDDNMMANLLDASPAASVSACPGCGNAMPGGALVCMNCGYNARVGKAAKTTVVRTPVASQMPAKRANRYASESVGPSFWKAFLVSSLVLAGAGLLPIAGQAGFMIALVVLCLASLAAWIGGTSAAFKNGQTLWGICGVVMIVPIANIAGAIGFFIYNLLFNQDSVTRALYWAQFIGAFALGIGMGIAMAMGQQLELFGTPLGGPVP